VSPLSGDSVHYGIRLFGLWRNDGLKVLPVKGLSREALVTACKTGCPVARSVKGGIEISSELDLT
jgi:hypothetical protein